MDPEGRNKRKTRERNKRKKQEKETEGISREKERNGISMIPKDPAILLSFINLKLRDYYRDLDALCEDLNADRQEISEKLAEIGCHYDGRKNQFVSQ